MLFDKDLCSHQNDPNGVRMSNLGVFRTYVCCKLSGFSRVGAGLKYSWEVAKLVKAPDFDSGIRRFEPFLPCHYFPATASQHLTHRGIAIIDRFRVDVPSLNALVHRFFLPWTRCLRRAPRC